MQVWALMKIVVSVFFFFFYYNSSYRGREGGRKREKMEKKEKKIVDVIYDVTYSYFVSQRLIDSQLMFTIKIRLISEKITTLRVSIRKGK